MLTKAQILAELHARCAYLDKQRRSAPSAYDRHDASVLFEELASILDNLARKDAK